MTVSELVAEIAKRLNDEDNIMYSASIIKSYLFPAMSVVFSSDMVTESDYFGLVKNNVLLSSSYAFGFSIKKILSVKGNTGTVRYIPKTREQIDEIAGSDFLLPEDGEAFYYLIGSTIRFIGGDDDTEKTVYYVEYPQVLSDSVDLLTKYSPTFIELAVRETINTIIKELDVRT